jgi:hypothetical protein
MECSQGFDGIESVGDKLRRVAKEQDGLGTSLASLVINKYNINELGTASVAINKYIIIVKTNCKR